MNKGARDFRVWKGCLRKRAFPSLEAAAAQKGQTPYRCQHCGFWHRTGALGKLIATVRRR